MEPTSSQTSPAVPLAIICGFGLIALVIFFTNNNKNEAPIAPAPAAEVTTQSGTPMTVTDDDYILGNPNAPILIIEYSDYDCPFCKRFHQSMNEMMEDYGITGQVAWVYRQFPITKLHPNAAKVAEAALCVGDIGGDEAFWKFSNRVYQDRQDTDYTNVTKIPRYVEEAGVSLEEHEACLASDRVIDRLEREIQDAVNIGAEGTPHTVIVFGNQMEEISGSVDYDFMKGVVEIMIDQLEGTFDPNATTTPQQ